MTRVRRLNVSQVEGGGSNDNNTNKIRPYGELALYVGDNNKLELLMFDGVRTHVNSKVLSKGTFYGGDADSSDGLNYDSIKLVPDEFLRRDGSDQYVIIEPTGGEPGHVHIRAGGSIDSSTADLFLGGEKNNVRVSDTNDRVTITTDAGFDDITRTWTFDANGDLVFPGATSKIGESEPGLVVFSDNRFAILTNAATTSSQSWIFDTDGDLTFPSNLVITPIGDFAPVTGTFITQAPGEFLGIVSTGDGGGSQIGWAENAFVPGRTAALAFNAGNAGDVDIITGDYTGTVYTWIFRANGILELPGGGEITSNEITNEVFGTTTTSLTLVPAGATDAGQRLEIYSTIGDEGNHLHLTSGSTSTELYLGNDSQYVKLGSSGEIEVSAQSGLTLRGEGAGSYAYLTLPNNVDSSSTMVTLNNSNGDVLIRAAEPSDPAPQQWAFGKDGSLKFTDGTSTIRALNTTTDGLPGLSLFAPERIFLGISGTSTNWSWDFRNYGQSDYSTDKKPAVMLPGGSVIEEDLTNPLLNNGMAGPLTVSSQDNLTLRTNTLDEAQSPTATYDWVFGKDGVLTFPNDDLTVSSIENESRIWTTATDITVYRNGQDGYGIKENEVSVYVSNSKITQVVPTGLEIVNGSLKFPDSTIQTTAFIIGTAPLSSTSTGTAGTIAYDASYFYVCTATNRWQRIGWDPTPW